MHTETEIKKLAKHIESLKKQIDRQINENRIEIYNYDQPILGKTPKIHKKQVEFHRDAHRIKALFGGNRTGKTVGGATEAVFHATGNCRFRELEPSSGWVVSLSNEVQRDVAQKEILHWLPKKEIRDIIIRHGRKDDPENSILDKIILKNGETIGFKSCEQGRESFQGTSKGWIWFDEEPPEDIYRECRMRVLDTQGDIWFTMTPLKGLTWIYDNIYLNKSDDPNIKYWTMAWDDNPWLSKNEIKVLESTMTEEEREARQYGHFVALSGLVYKEFRDDIHVIEPFKVPVDWYDNISIDPGYTNPLSCHFYAVDNDGNILVIAEHYEAERTIEYHSKEIKKIADSLNWPRNANGKLRALIDSAANQRTAASEKSVVQLLHEHGIVCNSKVNKDVWTGIQRVKQYLRLREHPDKEAWPRGKPKLFIFANCTNMIREIKSYRWMEPKEGVNPEERPKKTNDHSMDELRYYAMTKPDPYEGAETDGRYKVGGNYFMSELLMRGLNKREILLLEKKGKIKIIGG
ncbi:MAG: phage terminase large subunit [Deltaproteobacteria bacterium]|nr:phage terminase large subunit [Deltaproteobacteria bacterium]